MCFKYFKWINSASNVAGTIFLLERKFKHFPNLLIKQTHLYQTFCIHDIPEQSSIRQTCKRSQTRCCCVTGAQIRPDLWHDNQRLVSLKECQDITYGCSEVAFPCQQGSPSFNNPIWNVRRRWKRNYVGSKGVYHSGHLYRGCVISTSHCVCFTCPDKKILLRLGINVGH